MIRNIVQNCLFKQNRIILLRNASATTINDKTLEDISKLEDAEVAVEEDEQAREAEIEMKRNKSGLREQHRNILHNKMPYSEPILDFHKTAKYQRKLYGVYGDRSGVHPGICWPTKQVIEDVREYEKIAFPYTIQEMMTEAAEKRKEIEDTRRKRQEDIVKKFAKLEQWKKELKDKIEKKEAEARVVKERKDRLVEEVRRHFGFKIDPRDERFKEMLEQKERAEKKAMKEAKRKIKEARLVAKLQEKKTASAADTTANNVITKDGAAKKTDEN